MSYIISNQQAIRSNGQAHGQRRVLSITLWSIQIVLALIFLFAGSMKLILPIELMTAQMPMPGLFLRFIGICEVAGALGLILPGVTHIQRRLTPLASCGLIAVMLGAVVLTSASAGIASAAVPFIVGILAASIAYGRRSWAAKA